MGSSGTPAEIIRKATEAPGVFTFTELLQIECIKQLEPSSPLHHLIRLFRYGVYGDISKAPIPHLSDLQIHKLRLLTILSACENRQYVPYDVLLKSLGLSSLRVLEDLIIELIYANAIVGKLNQQKMVLEVETAIVRDFKEQDLPKIKSDLDTWCERVNTSLKELSDNLNTASALRSEFESAQKNKNQNNSAQVENMEVDTGMGDEEPDNYPEPTSSSGDKIRKGPLKVLQKGRKAPK